MKKLSKHDEKGVKAIIDLQALAGIKEPRDKAIRGWFEMDAIDREQTLLAHEAMCGGK